MSLFIADDKIPAYLIPLLDRISRTQHKATMSAGKRSRRHVSELLEALGYGSAQTANDRNVIADSQLTQDLRGSKMPRSYMELIFIDSEGLARKTDLESFKATDAETWAAFRSLRRYAVDIKKATFLIDYHKANHDIADTIAIDDTGFAIITGQPPESDAFYCKIDSDYWAAAQSKAA